MVLQLFQQSSYWIVSSLFMNYWQCQVSVTAAHAYCKSPFNMSNLQQVLSPSKLYLIYSPQPAPGTHDSVDMGEGCCCRVHSEPTWPAGTDLGLRMSWLVKKANPSSWDTGRTLVIIQLVCSSGNRWYLESLRQRSLYLYMVRVRLNCFIVYLCPTLWPFAGSPERSCPFFG